MKPGTIFALASGTGRAGVAVIRVSGAGAGRALEAVMRGTLPPPRMAVWTGLCDPGSGEVLDEGLVLWFPGPASFTGEDVVEFHVHGGRAVPAGVLDALGAVDGLRPAEPGEFTRRAFENGKLDLTAAEGLADLVDAETAAQRRQALRQMQGGLGRRYEAWRQRLLAAAAHVEATLDFSDEDLPGGLEVSARGDIAALHDEISAHLWDQGRGERLRHGVSVAIIGAPNAGKSSLLNLLARRDAAIVSETAGTTRDVIEVHLDLGGYPVVVADTAGLRAVEQEVESEGVRRAEARALEADLKLALFDRRDWPQIDARTAELVDEDTLVLLNKIDLAAPRPPYDIAGQEVRAISVKDGSGIDGLLEELQNRVENLCHLAGHPALTRVRHRTALEECRDALERFAETESSPTEAALAAEDLRLASRALGRITGRLDVEDILDAIFAEFCIGK